MVVVCGSWPPPWVPQRGHTPSGQIPCSLHGLGSWWVPLNKAASAHAWHTTLPTPRGAGERALDLQALMLVGAAVHLLPSTGQGWLLLAKELLEVRFQWWRTLQIFISFDWDSPSLFPWSQPISFFMWYLLSLSHCWGQLVGLIHSGVMFQAHFCWQGWSPFGEGHLTLLPGGTGWLGPSSSGAPSVWKCPGHPLVEVNIHPSSLVAVCLGTFQSDLRFPMIESHLGISFLIFWGPGPPVSVAAGVLGAAGASAASGASMGGGMAHSFHPFFQDCGCCQGHCWVCLMRAIISSYESQFIAVNFSCVLWFMAANAIQGSGQGASASNCICFPQQCGWLCKIDTPSMK